MEKNLTSGSVFKNIVFFSLPYLLSYFLQTLYGMADLFIIGQFEGVDSITATMGSTNTRSSTVETRATAINKVTVFPITDAVSCFFRAPTAFPITTVEPMASPTIITVSICMTWLPTETAVMLSTPSN